MSTEENKVVVRRWFEEVMSQGQVETVDLLCMQCHPGFTVIHGVFDSPSGGLDGVRDMVRMFRTAFPDAQFSIEEQIAEGNKVVLRLTIHATHKGDFSGLAATGKPVTMSGISIWELAEGKLVQEQVIWDTLGMLQQLGVVPPLGQAS